jgi:hypothetical protein
MAKSKKKKAPKEKKDQPLARPGDPYVGPDQRVLTPEPISRTPAIDLDAKVDPAQLKSSQRRVFKDLPTTVNNLNGIACIFMFTMLGISDREMASALKITIGEVRQVRSMPAYDEVVNMVISEFINANSDSIQSRLAAYMHGAVSQVARIAFTGTKESNVLRASQDILDRGGLSKKDAMTRGNDSLTNELCIKIIKGDQQVNVSLNGGGHGVST